MRAEAPPSAVEFITDRSGVFEDVLQETVLITLRRGRPARPVHVSFNRGAHADVRAVAEPAGTFPRPPDPQAPWLLPRTPDDTDLLRRLVEMPYRLADYGYRVSTGPLVWNRHRGQLTARGDGHGVYPLLWAESVLPGGAFRFTAARRNHAPYVRVTPGQEHLVTRETCALVQRTTATAFLNSAAADRVFRCISGSVAVSADELAAMPLPGPAVMRALSAAVERGGSAAERDAILAAAYRLSDTGA